MIAGVRKLFGLSLAVIGITVLVSAGPVSAVGDGQPLDKRSERPVVQYFALGDSVSSGLGLGNVPPSSNFENSICGRSLSAYPHEVSRLLNEKADEFGVSVNLTNISCQGATTGNLHMPQNFSGIEIPSQLNRAFSLGVPFIITMTIGVNDTGWSEFVGSCLSANNCDTAENTEILEKRLVTMQTRLNSGLAEIERRGGSMPPLVIATGYYQPISEKCVGANVTIQEVQWLNQAQEKLNRAIYSATEGSHPFARFAPVDFADHDICSEDPWIQRPGEAAPFHPTATGQQVIAKSVFAKFGPQ